MVSIQEKRVSVGIAKGPLHFFSVRQNGINCDMPAIVGMDENRGGIRGSAERPVGCFDVHNG